MVPVITAASLDQTVLSKTFIVFAQPACASRVVGQKEEEQKSACDGDNAFDDEQPSEPFQACCTVDMSDAISNGSTKSSREVAECHNKSNPDGSFVVLVPDRDEVYDTCNKAELG